MRALSAIVTLAALAVPSAFAQKLWQPEIGIRGGYARIKPAGTGASDAIDLYDIPGSNFLNILASYGTVYAVVPWTNRIALEPSLNLSQSTPSILVGTHITFGLRADYAFTSNLYAAAGGVLAYVSGGGTSVRQVGLQGAAGVRLGPERSLSGRIEAQTTLFHKTADLGPYNVYAITFGVTGRLSGTAARPPSRSSRQGFEPALGIQGGYTQAHVVGSGGDLVTLSAPGGGSALLLTGFAVGARPSTLFAIVPVGARMAVDVGFDAHQARFDGFPLNGAIFSAHLLPRIDLAIGSGWYAAAGPSFSFVRTPNLKLSAASGASVAWGYRFPLGPIGGRVEASYTMTAAHNGIGSPPVNTMAISIGALFPLR